MSTPFQVIAYSGYQGEQEPRALVVEGNRLAVVGIVDRWYDPAGKYFKVRAEDGVLYLVRCDSKTLEWSLVQRWMLDA